MGYFKWTVTAAWHINCFRIAFSFLMDATQVALPEERLCAESEDWPFTCFRKRYVDMSGEKTGFEKETLSPRRVTFVSYLSLVLSTSHSECLQFIFERFLHSAQRSGICTLILVPDKVKPHQTASTITSSHPDSGDTQPGRAHSASSHPALGKPSEGSSPGAQHTSRREMLWII